MDIKVLLSIYNKPWLVEPNAAAQMLEMLEGVKAGGNWEYNSKQNDGEATLPEIYQKFFAADKVSMAPSSERGMYSFKGFEGAKVAIIPISGPLMKNDYCGALGTQTLKQLTRMASNTESVQTIIYLIDSPGGSVDGTQAFADEIKASTKRTIAVIDGYMCSAAYWIGSSCNELYASNKTDICGSIGTMCTLVDNTEAMKLRGSVIREYYATASAEKNKMFNDALTGNGKALIAEMLDPLNDMFLATVKANRGNKINADEVLNGKTFLAEKAVEVGLIDGIKTLDEVLQVSMQQVGVKSNLTIINNTKNKVAMTPAEIKSQHPESYNAIVAEGEKNEKIRVKSWLSWMDTDKEVVMQGIETGAEVDRAVISEMSAKAANKIQLGAVQAASPAPIATENNPEKELSAEELALKANAAALDEIMGFSGKK